MNRRTFGKTALSTLALLAIGPRMAFAGDWDAILAEAKGQTVYWHAWGGDPKINDFIAFIGAEAQARHGVTLEHVKLASTADAVARVLAERDAGQSTGGAVDLIWINGENFAAMKAQGLLFGPFAETLPNWPLVDTVGKPATVTDFTLPTEGFESPWAMAQLVFEHDSATLPAPPKTLVALQDWIKANPGRFTYPQPPDYLGVTFLKQVLHGTLADPSVLQAPLDPATYEATVAPLWAFLDDIHPSLWRQAQVFPENEPALGQLLADGEIGISFAFNPGRASAEIAAGTLPDTIRTFVLEGGTIGNASFVAIPFNAAHKEGAMVVADFLLEPETQARAQDIRRLGTANVLDTGKLSPEQRRLFEELPGHPALPAQSELGAIHLEPHASWMTRIAAEWSRRTAR